MEACVNLFQLDDDDIFNSDSFLEELEHVERSEQPQVPSKHSDLQQTNKVCGTHNVTPPTLAQDKGTSENGPRKFSFRTKTAHTTTESSGELRNSTSTCMVGNKKISEAASSVGPSQRAALTALPSNALPQHSLITAPSAPQRQKGVPLMNQSARNFSQPHGLSDREFNRTALGSMGNSGMGVGANCMSTGRGPSPKSFTSVPSSGIQNTSQPRRQGQQISPAVNQGQQISPAVNQGSVHGMRVTPTSQHLTPTITAIQGKQALSQTGLGQGPSRGPSPFSQRKISPPQQRPEPTPVHRHVTTPQPRHYQSPVQRQRPDPHQRQTPSPHQRQTPTPYQRQTPSSHQIQTPSLHQRHTPTPYQMQTPSPHQRQTPTPYQMQTPSPHQRQTPTPYQMQTPSPHQRQTPTPYQMQTPSPHQRQTPTPYQRQTPSSHQRQTPSLHQRQPLTPAQGGTSAIKRQGTEQTRRVLTPRVAQLCQGSTPSSGAVAKHGVARKFPGPAGLLPKLNPGQNFNSNTEVIKTQLDEEDTVPEHKAAAQEEAEVGDFEHGAWRRMESELGLRDGNTRSVHLQNNIALVIRKASLKQLSKNKVNHLCVMVKSISLNARDASVTLCDPSGEMQGTIHRTLVEEHQAELRPGCVLVLRQIGVLSPSQRNHYLNITPSNLVRVFAPESGNARQASQGTPRRGVRTSPGRSSERTPARRRQERGVVDATPEPCGNGNGVDTGRDTKEVSWEELEGEWEEIIEDCAADHDDPHVMSGEEGQVSHCDQDTAAEESISNAKRSIESPDEQVLRLSENHDTLSSKKLRGPSSRLNSVHSSSSGASKNDPVVPTLASSSSKGSSRASSSSSSSSSLSSSSRNLPLISTIESSGVVREVIKRNKLPPSHSDKHLSLPHPDTKRVSLVRTSCLETKDGSGKEEQNFVTKELSMTAIHQHESIGDLLDGIEEELFDDF